MEAIVVILLVILVIVFFGIAGIFIKIFSSIATFAADGCSKGCGCVIWIIAIIIVLLII